MPCDPPPADGVPCYRGDNIFIDVFPGKCSEWQYDVPNNHSLGMLWCALHQCCTGTVYMNTVIAGLKLPSGQHSLGTASLG